MMGVVVSMTKVIEVQKEKQVVKVTDTTEPVELYALDSQVTNTTKKARGGMYRKCSILNFNF